VIAATDVSGGKHLSLSTPPSKGWSVIIPHVRSTSALVVAVVVAFVVAVAVVSTKCNEVMQNWRREGDAPCGCCYFASEATLLAPFRLPFFIAVGVPGAFLIRNDAGT
jgi:hypothetical protein